MSVKRYTVRWDGERGRYTVDKPNWNGGEVVAATDYDAIAAERDALKARNAALEAKIPDSGQYREYDDLIVERDALLAQAERLAGALDKIACWDEGPVVTGSFDEPGSAKAAREALAAWREFSAK